MKRGKPKPSDGHGSSIQAVEQGNDDSASKSSTPSVDGPSHDVFLPSDQQADSPSLNPRSEHFSFAQKSRLGVSGLGATGLGGTGLGGIGVGATGAGGTGLGGTGLGGTGLGETGLGGTVPAADAVAIATGDQHLLAGKGDPKRKLETRKSQKGAEPKRQRVLEPIEEGQLADREPSTPDQPATSEVSIGESPLMGGRTRREAKKIIIDTDPGIDDAFAILLALQSPELEVVALTTIFGNVRTPLATSNALHLLELAGRSNIPVIQGEVKSLKGVAKERIASFVHGDDGLGNTWPNPPLGKALTGSAAQYLVDAVKTNPREMTIVALGPLTNLAQAVLLDPTFASNVGEIVILGGAFMSNGNANPVAEANILGDPEAADLVFGCGAAIKVIGLDVTRHIIMTEAQLQELRDSDGPFGKYLHDASLFYLKYHVDTYKRRVIMLHDPSVMMAVIDPSLFTFREGPARVEVEDGPFRALTLAYFGNKKWAAATEWCSRPSIEVAVACRTQQIVDAIMERLMRPSLVEI